MLDMMNATDNTGAEKMRSAGTLTMSKHSLDHSNRCVGAEVDVAEESRPIDPKVHIGRAFENWLPDGSP